MKCRVWGYTRELASAPARYGRWRADARCALVAVVAAAACSSSRVTVGEIARIITPAICRRNEACEPDAFRARWGSQAACRAEYAAVQGGDDVEGRCTRAYWETCARAIDDATCEQVIAGGYPAACLCPE